MHALSHRIYRFDDFEVDVLKRQLHHRDRPVTLQPKAFDLLLALVENRGQLLTKDDLLNLVWPDQIVEESNLTVHMSALRKALGEQKGIHRFVVLGESSMTSNALKFCSKDSSSGRVRAGLVSRGEETHLDLTLLARARRGQFQ